MSPKFHQIRLLNPLLLVLTFAAASRALPNVTAEESDQQKVELVRGKTLDAWIAQVAEAATLEDRQNALQVLRNDGIQSDRNRTLRAFSDALSDKSPSVRSLAAAGLLKAGKPTDPKALQKLVEIISRDLSTAKPPEQASVDKDDFDFPIREIRALGAIGEAEHIPLLTRITENKKVHHLLRKFADDAISQIRERTDVTKARSPR